MGNKTSVSEGEDEEERPAPTALRGVPSLAAPELANGGSEEADDEVELPPPMKPIQEPILVTSGPPGGAGPVAPSCIPTIDDNSCKRVRITLISFKLSSLTLSTTDSFNLPAGL